MKITFILLCFRKGLHNRDLLNKNERKLYSLNVSINYYYYFRSSVHFSTVVISVNFFELKSGPLF